MKKCAKCGENNGCDEATCYACGAVFAKVEEVISSGYERNKFLAQTVATGAREAWRFSSGAKCESPHNAGFFLPIRQSP